MNRQIRSTIARLGKEVTVKTRSESGTDAFNNPESSWSASGSARCVRTYPNRNSQINNEGGRYNEDRAVFIFEAGEAPGSGARIDYEGTTYELQSPTRYDTHVAIFGEPVTN